MSQPKPRFDTLQIAALIALTGVLVFLGVISFTNQLSWREPTDDVTWELRGGRVVAAEMAPQGAGARAGIRAGDELLSFDGQPPVDPAVVEMLLFARDVGEIIEYQVDRAGTQMPVALVVGGNDVDNHTYFYLAFVGLAFLTVGVFALLRQPEAPARHSFALAVGFYLLLALSPTTRAADPWNTVIFWLDQLARDIVPGLFVFFALTFPRPKKELEESRSAVLLAVFAPGVALLVVNVLSQYGGPWLAMGAIMADRLFNIGQRAELLYFAAALALGVLLLAHTFKTGTAPLERMRLKWLVGGLALGFLPFLAIYVPMELLEIDNAALTNVAVLPLMLVPLSFGYAAVGFRLWDVEVMLKRGMIYALASLVMLSVYLATQWALGLALGADDELVKTASLLATLAVALGFAPLRDKLQDLADRLYYRDAYRARRTLMDFGRELNSETDLACVVELLVQRVRETMGVGRVAVLLRVQEKDQLRIVSPNGRLNEGSRLSSNFSQFVAGALAKREVLFVDDLSGLLDEFPEDREVLEAEALAYFLPLEVKGDIIGVLALGRKLSGDFLSTDDLKVLQPLASHVALAIDNALLYREVKQRSRELEQLKTYNENIVESIQGGVMVLDDHGVVLSWNRSLQRIHGIGAEMAVGKPVGELFPSGFLKVLDDARSRLHRGIEPLTSAYRIALRTHGGEDRVVTLSMAPLLGDSDDPLSTVIIVDDVTERTELESQLRQAEKLASVGLLAAGVAHEVNTPLAGISSYVQMLRRKVPETDPRHAILEKIEKQTFRASQIVNNLLNFSRQETGEFRDVSLNAVVHDTLALAEIQLRKRNIVVTTELADDVRSVTGDPVKLQQVLMNLLLNARDAMPSGGSLKISTLQLNGDTCMQVRDTGVGIADTHIDKVYDPFFTTKGVGKGTGLGLSVSYGIIQEHRGTITVDSEPGEGTTFRVSLPANAAGTVRAAAS